MEDLEKVSLSKALEVEQIKNERLNKELNMYNGEFGIHNHFKQMFIKMLEQHEVTDTLVAVLKDEIQEEVVSEYEYLGNRLDELENKPDEYEITDTVVDSMTFESRVEEIVNERLQEINFKVTIEE